MKCRICNVDKLSREFPSKTITKECKHPPYYCLRCVTKKVKANWVCPYENCDRPVEQNSECLKECEALLDFLFPPMEAPPGDLQTDVESGPAGNSHHVVHVATLTGDTESFQFLPMMTVVDLKRKIKEKMAVETDKQRLIYKEQELESYKPDGNMHLLNEYNVKPFATIHLMILLYAIPESFDHVIFDLSWKYPSSGRDFLDASCHLFMGDVWYCWTDWRYPNIMPDEVWHSGDKMDDKKCIGHHKIEAKLKNIPKCVSHLVFTLSSFKSPSIGRFPEPTLRFYDARDTNKELPHAKFTQSLNCTALIVCCMSRGQNNMWEIYKGGQRSGGNAKQYRPMIAEIQKLITSKQFPGVSLAHGKSRIRDMTDEEARKFYTLCEKR